MNKLAQKKRNVRPRATHRLIIIVDPRYRSVGDCRAFGPRRVIDAHAAVSSCVASPNGRRA